MLSLSGHKMHGPKGSGILFIKKGTNLSPLIYGGAQERNLRAGTENVAAIAGLGKALENIFPDIENRNRYISALRDRLKKGLLKVTGVKFNGNEHSILPGHCNISVENIDGESLLLMLDLKGICASAGSACTSGDTEPSHVLTSMGLSPEQARSSVRFSLDEYNTEEEIDYIISSFTEIVEKIRKM